MQNPRSALLLLGLLASACSSEPASFDAAAPDVQLGFDVRGSDVIRTDRGPTPELVDLTDVPPLTDAGMRDGPCAETLPGDLRFGTEGGFQQYNTTYTVSPPRRFLLEGTGYPDGGVARCETTIPACGAADDVTVDRLAAALSDPALAAALLAAATTDAGTVFYGVDSRPIDGSVFFMERGGRFVYVGDPCRTSGGGSCVDAPVGLQHLVDVLNALSDQESLRPVCAAALGDAGA